MINRLSRYINKFITKLDIQVSGSSKLFHLPGMFGSDCFKESFLKVTHHVYGKLIKKTFAVHFKQSDLVLNRQRSEERRVGEGRSASTQQLGRRRILVNRSKR